MNHTKLLLQSLSTQLHLIQETLRLLKIHLQNSNTSLKIKEIQNDTVFFENISIKNNQTKLSKKELDELYTRILEKETSW